MLRLAFGIALLWQTIPGEAAALRLTGAMVYSTDELGNPSDYDVFGNGTFGAHLWRSVVTPQTVWYGLGILPGAPPASLDQPFLNAADFTIDVEVLAGESRFTVLAEPGPLTRTDDFHGWALNLYFDGDNDSPAIAVVAPRYGEPNGSPPVPSQANADQVYSLDVQQVAAPAPFVYEDARVRVTVIGFSLLPPELAGVSVDRLRPYRRESSGTDEFVGVLTLHVEDLGGSSSDGCAIAPGGASPGPVWLLVMPAAAACLRMRPGWRPRATRGSERDRDHRADERCPIS